MFIYKSLISPRLTHNLLAPISHTNRHSSTRFHNNNNNNNNKNNTWGIFITGGICLTGYVLYRLKYARHVLCEERDEDVIKQKTDAFIRRYTMNYENRIRMYSLPDKIFRLLS